MGAPIFFQDNIDLWVSNAAKDHFCDVVVKASEMRGNDISVVFEDEPAIAGCYGISGLGIDLEAFFKYFGGKKNFIAFLDYSRQEVDWICDTPKVASSTYHLLSWAIHILEGGRIASDEPIYNNLPDGNLEELIDPP